MTRSSQLAALAASAALARGLVAPREAEAHGRGAPGRGPVIVRGFYGFPYFGFGNPYWGYPYWGWPPAFYGPPGGVDMGAAMVAGFGAIDLHVKPGQAEVWVDGKFVAEARDLDGYPSYLWLPEGAHRLTIYKGGYQKFEEEIDVRRGTRMELKVRLQKGESEPPGERPGKSAKG